MASLPQLPGGSPLLRYTAALVLAAYAEWLAATEATGRMPPELVPRLLQMLTAGVWGLLWAAFAQFIQARFSTHQDWLFNLNFSGTSAVFDGRSIHTIEGSKNHWVGLLKKGAVHAPGLLDREVADAAALALRHVCDALGPALAPHLEALMALYARVQSCGEASASSGAPPPPPGQRALEEGNVQQARGFFCFQTSAAACREDCRPLI
jgi:hypothetical protein